MDVVALASTTSNNKIVSVHHEHSNSGLSGHNSTTNKRTPLKYTKAQCCGNNNDNFAIGKINKKNLIIIIN